jgi:hypothetical protein
MVRDKRAVREELTMILRSPNKTANLSSPFFEPALFADAGTTVAKPPGPLPNEVSLFTSTA